MKPNESPLDPTERILAAFQSMMQRQMPHHASELNTIDVTMAQAKALYALVAAGELRMSDLAARLGVTSSTATGVVDRLVELSLAVRHDDPHDRRQVVISATPRAHAELERFRELNAAQMRHLLSFVDPADLPIIEHAIDLMSVAADAAASQPPAVTPESKKGDRP